MSEQARVMVVEDDAALNELLVEELSASGYDTESFRSVEAALPRLEPFEPDLVITDLQLPKQDGMAVLRGARERTAPPAVLMITAYGTVERAVEALKAGADNFLTKPLDMEHFMLSCERLIEHRRLKTQVARFRDLYADRGFHGLLGQSRVMRELFERVRQIARTDGPVLLSGESGTGKEGVARAIHAESPRAGKPFLAVNCAGVPGELLESEFFGYRAGAFTGAERERAGLFREADGGTLLLDEIGEMPAALQAKLLRALQDGRIRPVGEEHEIQVNVRVVAATNRDLGSLVRNDEFREDLYYRLETFHLDVPPLRDRDDDLEKLAWHFLTQHAAAGDRPARELGPEALKAIKAYPWPGNVRELENAMERAVTFCNSEVIQPAHLPERVRRDGTKPEAQNAQPAPLPAELLDGDMLPSLDELRDRYVHYVLERVDGNKRRAAALLGVGRRTLYRWLA